MPLQKNLQLITVLPLKLCHRNGKYRQNNLNFIFFVLLNFIIQFINSKRIGRMNISGRPKLFGGSLEEYLEAACEDIPLIMRSCIRVINLYGLHHQGIFRVSGSQVEISNFREWFERGDDPLADTTDASDINSVAGVLKLYLRELREPIFPIIYFDHLLSIARKCRKLPFLSHFFKSSFKKLSNMSRNIHFYSFL